MTSPETPLVLDVEGPLADLDAVDFGEASFLF